MPDEERDFHNKPPQYLESFVTGKRPDGGWICLHGAILELCKVCTAMLDRRYEIIYNRRGPEASNASS